MNDDFNTPILIAQLFEGVKYVHLIKDQKEFITEADKNLLKNTFHIIQEKPILLMFLIAIK